MPNDNSGAAGGGGGKGGGGSVTKLPTLTRGQRLELADILVHWSAALDGARENIDTYADSVRDLRRLGAALDEMELDQRIVQGLLIVRQLALHEELSKTTRKYLRDVLGIAAAVEIPE